MAAVDSVADVQWLGLDNRQLCLYWAHACVYKYCVVEVCSKVMDGWVGGLG